MDGPTLPCPVEDLVPHRRPMLVVDRLVALFPDGGAAEAEVRPDGPFTGPDGALDPAAFVELVAQAFAAAKGWQQALAGPDRSRPAAGFLVGLKGFRITGQARQGDLLRVEARVAGTFEDFAVVRGEVRRGEELLASGQVKVWAPEAPEGA